MRKSRILFILLIAFAVLIGAIAGLGFIGMHRSLVVDEKGFVYYLHPGISKNQFVTELSQQGVFRHPVLLSIYLYSHPTEQLKTGEYFFPKGSNLISVWKQVTTGTGLYNRAFTIIPGWTFTQLKQALAKDEILQHNLANLTDKQIMERLGFPNLAPEGQFLPETYYYTRGNSEEIILKKSFNLMQKKLTEKWQNRAANLPYQTPYEALIVASLIEKEAYLNSEKPLIASVIINRLNQNMLLQIDPTVIYGMGDRYQGKIHKEDLKQDTPYNTYVHKGLPPTPIAMPGIAAIDAALHPQNTEFLYFVAKGDGSHQFSKTLTEHNAAVDISIKHKQTSYFNNDKVRQYLYRSIAQSGSFGEIHVI